MKKLIIFLKAKKIRVSKVTYVSIWEIILLCVFLLLLFYGACICRYRFLSSMEHSNIAIGKVTKVVRDIDTNSSEFLLFYSYNVSGQEYDTAVGVTEEDLSKLSVESRIVSRYIWIRHSIAIPENSMVIFDSLPKNQEILKFQH